MIDTQSIRCSILKLAFSGKLTDQLNSDEDVDSLLAQISKDGTIRKLESGPFEIPDSWAWVRLGDLYTINPKVSADDEVEAAFIPMERISAGFERNFTYEIQNWGKASKNHTRFADGDIAFAKITPCFENRKSFIAEGLPNGIGGGTTELIILRQPDILPEYTYYLLLDQRFISEGVGSYKGSVGQQRVQMDVIKDYPIPLAPYSEQVRIIDKIKQAFSVLDMIDSMQADYSNNMIVLKSKLIDLAIQGKLTEQLPEDGSAEELYLQIQEEKQNLIKAGKIKKEKALSEIIEDEIPFDIPDNWKWCRLGSLFNFIDYRGATPNKISLGVPFVTAKNVRQGYMDYTKKEYISKEDYLNRQSRGISKKGDLLFTTEAPMGYAAIADLEEYSAGQRLITLQQFTKQSLLINKYFMYTISAHFFQKQLDEKSSGTTVKGIKADRLMSLLIPLPPIEIQIRIVSMLESLLALVQR